MAHSRIKLKATGAHQKATETRRLYRQPQRRVFANQMAAPYPMSPTGVASTARRQSSLSRWIIGPDRRSHQVEITHKLDFLTPPNAGSKLLKDTALKTPSTFTAGA